MQSSILWKSLIIGAIIILLMILLSIISGTISEREQFRNQANHSVANSWTREQILTLPILVVAYQKISEEKVWDKSKEAYGVKEKVTNHIHYEPLKSVSFSTQLQSRTLRRGIFDIPVYQADIQIQGRLSTKFLRQLKAQKNIHLTQLPFIAVGVSDQRGFISTPTFSMNNQQQQVQPGSGLLFNSDGFRVTLNSNLKDSDIALQFSLKGMTGFHLLPTAKSTQVTISSDWPHPSFGGAFLPDKREISDRGYTAVWHTSYFSSAVAQRLKQCAEGDCDLLQQLSFGVSHIQPVDHYVKSERSIKYGVLIIVLTFASFLLFEVVKAIPLHPVHYLLVGLALSIFYLLLTALAEHINFALSYGLSALACSLLIWGYMVYQLGRKQSSGLLFALLSLYFILYLIIQSEDFAFLAGSLLCFFCLAAIMLTTRKVNWRDWQKTHSKASF